MGIVVCATGKMGLTPIWASAAPLNDDAPAKATAPPASMILRSISVMD
jgi:hypothetical protein